MQQAFKKSGTNSLLSEAHAVALWKMILVQSDTQAVIPTIHDNKEKNP